MNVVGNGVVGRKKFLLLIFIYHRMYSVITRCVYLRVHLELAKNSERISAIFSMHIRYLKLFNYVTLLDYIISCHLKK